MVKTRKPETRMIAAECARRTGLTVRALRLYERLKLIKPSRSAKGWRLYGPEELIRLNTIVALKNFGLSLKQIRKVFSESQPELSQVLDMQIKVWASRKLAADRAIGQIRSALAHMATRAPLSIDELCELLRSSDMSNVQTITRELINQYSTPEQEREWLSYWAQRPEEAADSQARFREWRAIAQEFLAVMRNGALPSRSSSVFARPSRCCAARSTTSSAGCWIASSSARVCRASAPNRSRVVVIVRSRFWV